jgi:crotonobetainyl-CoA:carnitine CoA-transferase CaiB-like acyl-CoA transferase
MATFSYGANLVAMRAPRLPGHPNTQPGAVPKSGEHSPDILPEAGLSAAEIDQLLTSEANN